MGVKSLLSPVLVLLIAVNLATAIQWDFEFGDIELQDYKLYENSGDIGPFSYRNSYSIDVPLTEEVDYVKVTVWSISPPKVDYDPQAKTVSIVFSWIQVTISSFKIEVYGHSLIPGVNVVKGTHSVEHSSKEKHDSNKNKH